MYFTVIERSLPSHARPVAELKLPLLDKRPYSCHKRIHGEEAESIVEDITQNEALLSEFEL